MKQKSFAISVVAGLVFVSVWPWITSCKSTYTRWVDPRMDMEIYVEANIKYPTWKEELANIPLNDTMLLKDLWANRDKDLIEYNTLILFPYFKTYYIQEAMDAPIHYYTYSNFGSYIDRGDTIICIPDIKLEDTNEKIIIGDSINVACDLKYILWFKKVEDDVLVLWNPYDLYSIISPTERDFLWPKEDFEFKGVNLRDREAALFFDDKKIDSCYQEEYLKWGVGLRVFKRIPIKIKTKYRKHYPGTHDLLF